MPAVAEQRAILGESRINAALMLHVDGSSPDEAIDYQVEVGRASPDTAAKRTSFVAHPLWRLYDYVYTEGVALLRPWLEAVPPESRNARFGRLLREQLTPPAIRAETLAASTAGRGDGLRPGLGERATRWAPTRHPGSPAVRPGTSW